MSLGSTQLLAEMNTMDSSQERKDGRCLGLTTLPPLCCRLSENPGSLNPLQPSWHIWVCRGLALPLPSSKERRSSAALLNKSCEKSVCKCFKIAVTLMVLVIVVIVVCRNSVVVVATRYAQYGAGIESRWWRDFPHPSRPALGPHSLLYNEYWVFSWWYCGRGVALTTHPI
jgi:hypothetical protein